MTRNNKIALVTGGAKRIGKAFSLGLAKAGYDVAVHYLNSHSEAVEVLNEITSIGRRAAAFKADLSQPEAPRELSEKVLTLFGGLDLLVNNASSFSEPDLISGKNTLLTETIDSWELSLAVNARAPFYLIQSFASALKRTGGRIVNILDESAETPWTGRASHTISKSALKVISDLAHQTLQPEVKVNAFQLGNILPGENMTQEEISKVKWSSIEEVVAALIDIVQGRVPAGQLIKVTRC